MLVQTQQPLNTALEVTSNCFYTHKCTVYIPFSNVWGCFFSTHTNAHICDKQTHPCDASILAGISCVGMSAPPNPGVYTICLFHYSPHITEHTHTNMHSITSVKHIYMHTWRFSYKHWKWHELTLELTQALRSRCKPLLSIYLLFIFIPCRKLVTFNLGFKSIIN